MKKQENLRNSLVLLGVSLLWHVAQWVSRAPPHHTLPAFLNLNGMNWIQFLTNVVQIRCRHRAARPDPIFSPNRPNYFFLYLKNSSKVRFIYCGNFYVIRATFSSLYWHCLYHRKISFDEFKRIFIFNNIKIYFWKNRFFYMVKI